MHKSLVKLLFDSMPLWYHMISGGVSVLLGDLSGVGLWLIFQQNGFQNEIIGNYGRPEQKALNCQ